MDREARRATVSGATKSGTRLSTAPAAACTELGDVGQMSPTSRLRTRTSCHISGSYRLEIKCAINSMCLNRAETILPNPGPWKNYLSRNRSQGSNSWGPLYKGIVLLPFRTKIHSLNFRELQMTYRCVPLWARRWAGENSLLKVGASSSGAASIQWLVDKREQ